ADMVSEAWEKRPTVDDIGDHTYVEEELDIEDIRESRIQRVQSMLQLWYGERISEDMLLRIARMLAGRLQDIPYDRTGMWDGRKATEALVEVHTMARKPIRRKRVYDVF